MLCFPDSVDLESSRARGRCRAKEPVSEQINRTREREIERNKQMPGSCFYTLVSLSAYSGVTNMTVKGYLILFHEY